MIDFTFEDLEERFAREDEDNNKRLDELLKNVNPDIIRGMLPWDIAVLYNKIVHHDMFNSYFGDVMEFASLAGVSRATVYTNVLAVDFDKIHHFDHGAFSVTKVYQLSRTGQDYERFLEFLAEKKLGIESVSVMQLRDYIDEFYGKKVETNYEICIDGKLYRLPLKILNKYMISENVNNDNESNKIINSFSWRISTAQVAYKKIDKSVYMYNETGIPEDVREYWGVADLKPGESIDINVKFQENSYIFTIKRDAAIEPYRTKMSWYKDFKEILSKSLNYTEWNMDKEHYFLVFEKLSEDNYLLDVNKILSA